MVKKRLDMIRIYASNRLVGTTGDKDGSLAGLGG
jgi:hypothetical protein